MGKDYVLSVIKAAEPYLKDFGEFDWFKLECEEYFNENKE